MTASILRAARDFAPVSTPPRTWSDFTERMTVNGKEMSEADWAG